MLRPAEPLRLPVSGYDGRRGAMFRRRLVVSVTVVGLVVAGAAFANPVVAANVIVQEARLSVATNNAGFAADVAIDGDIGVVGAPESAYVITHGSGGWSAPQPLAFTT